MKRSRLRGTLMSRSIPCADSTRDRCRATRTSGEVKLVKDLDQGLEGRDLLVVEDIVDTGLTLNYLLNVLRARGPRTLKVASLLSKPSRRLVETKIDYVGFSIDDHFVVGYGLDYNEKHRNLSDIVIYS